MRNIRKFLCAFLAIAMMLSMTMVNVFAINATTETAIKIYMVPDKTTVAKGETVAMSVYVATDNDEDVTMGKLIYELNYDGDAFTASNGDYSPGAVMDEDTGAVTYKALPKSLVDYNTKGKVKAGDVSNVYNISANNPVTVINFVANQDIADGDYQFSFEYVTGLTTDDQKLAGYSVPEQATVITIGKGGDTPDPTAEPTAEPTEAPTATPEANTVTVNVGTAIVGRDFTVTVIRTDATEEVTVVVTITAKEGGATLTKEVTFAAGETKLPVTIPSDEMEVIADNGDSFDINVVYNGAEEQIEKTSTATMRKGGSSTGNSGLTTGSTGTIAGATATPGLSTDATPAPTEEPAVTTEPSAVVFEDVPATYWGYDYIMDLYENGIVNGTTATLFMPEANVTRAEFTKMAAGIFGLTATSTVSQFTDVPAGEWFTPYVIAASEAGIVQGVSETEFAPNDNVTREQMAAIIGRQLGTTSTAAITFTDAASIEDYARPYVAALAEAGYLTGDETGAFNPKNNATRAEAAALLDRVYVNLTADAPEVTEEPEATEAPEVTAEPDTDATAEPEATATTEPEADATAEPETTVEPEATATAEA